MMLRCRILFDIETTWLQKDTAEIYDVIMGSDNRAETSGHIINRKYTSISETMGILETATGQKQINP